MVDQCFLLKELVPDQNLPVVPDHPLHVVAALREFQLERVLVAELEPVEVQVEPVVALVEELVEEPVEALVEELVEVPVEVLVEEPVVALVEQVEVMVVR